ncbi:flagellar hook protein FlgE [Lebetimonas natsushimae]|uniref:Flagellar hook protein FlgE n=1 Tax=Lebetimonas natsushimae TaxID=1936991 RepID=A0A292YEY7_9BACT|nr:flagellar hook-basal body complex protein [Lebetimonas natsushimae]GAX87685.1 flagellar hook protein FlgE [Lebetimonas natsushimae]
MTRSFFNGVSGMKSFQNGIDIWSNNIANINTVGYKETQPEFASIFSQTLKSSPIISDVGLGGYLNANAINLSQGSFIDSDNPFDIALGGKGWLAVKKGEDTYYTRNGSFKRDAQGFLVDDNGDYLLVANANNIKNNNGNYEIDQNIPTDNLINNPLSPISLPNSMILPAIATSKIELFTNLNDANKINTTSPANLESDFSALYSKDGEDLKVRNGDSFVFGFGNPATYSNNLISSEICITNDEKDGKDLIYDFTINGKQINLTLPDGATKEEIQNALVDKLTQNGIDAQISDNGIIISNPAKIILHSNNNNLPNIAAEKLIYNANPTQDNEFDTMESLIDKLNTLAENENSNISVSLDNEGRIVTNNPTEKTINSYILKTETSNDLFINNLGRLGNEIYPQTAAKSYSFKVNKQNFGGNIFDKDGNKDLITFSFTKQKILNNQILWKGEITIKDENGNIINTTNQTFTFDANGQLLSPKSITLNSPQTMEVDFNLTSYAKTDLKNSYSFSQNGLAKGYLQGYEINDNGTIFANFSNSKSIAVAQIPIFHFQNPQGLESIGGNLFRETANSNKAFLYEKDGEYIPYAKVLPSKLETSNVNFAEAMTELIITQKAFSAAAKTVTTSDQMIQKAINLKRS